MLYKGLYNHITQLQQVIKSYLEIFPNEKQNFNPLFLNLKQDTNLSDPHNRTCHLTASPLILNPLNRKLLRPLESSVHFVDSDEDIMATAIRCSNEQLGNYILILHPWHLEQIIPFDISVSLSKDHQHEIPHLHYEFRYIFMYIQALQTKPIPEENKWLSIEELTVENKNKNSKLAYLTQMQSLI